MEIFNSGIPPSKRLLLLKNSPFSVPSPHFIPRLLASVGVHKNSLPRTLQLPALYWVRKHLHELPGAKKTLQRFFSVLVNLLVYEYLRKAVAELVLEAIDTSVARQWHLDFVSDLAQRFPDKQLERVLGALRATVAKKGAVDAAAIKSAGQFVSALGRVKVNRNMAATRFGRYAAILQDSEGLERFPESEVLRLLREKEKVIDDKDKRVENEEDQEKSERDENDQKDKGKVIENENDQEKRDERENDQEKRRDENDQEKRDERDEIDQHDQNDQNNQHNRDDRKRQRINKVSPSLSCIPDSTFASSPSLPHLTDSLISHSDQLDLPSFRALNRYISAHIEEVPSQYSALRILTFLREFNPPVEDSDRVPHPHVFYTLLLSSDPFMVSQMCGYLAWAKRLELPQKHKERLNSYVMDAVNYVWRDRALVREEGFETAFGLSSRFLTDLSKLDTFNYDVSPRAIGNLFVGPAWSYLTAQVVWALEEEREVNERHEGPITRESVKGGCLGSYDDVRVSVLKRLDRLGFSGLGELVFGSIRIRGRGLNN